MARFEVTLSRTTIHSRVVSVEAASSEEAEALALARANETGSVAESEWQFYDDSLEVVDVYDYTAEDA